MEKVNNAKLNQAIRIFPHTFCKDIFLNTLLEGHDVTIHEGNYYEGVYRFSVFIAINGKRIYNKSGLLLNECIQYIRHCCITYEQQINLERDLLFDTPIEA